METSGGRTLPEIMRKKKRRGNEEDSERAQAAEQNRQDGMLDGKDDFEDLGTGFDSSLNDLAKEVPTKRDPINPGPLVNAMASNCSLLIFATFKASLTTGTIFCWCALEANSGTTPPKDL